VPERRLKRTRDAYKAYDVTPTCIPGMFARLTEREDEERADRERTAVMSEAMK